MKYIVIYLSILLVSCNSIEVKRTNTQYAYRGSDIEILTIDSCEYLIISSELSFTHKGNCKYCKYRK